MPALGPSCQAPVQTRPRHPLSTFACSLGYPDHLNAPENAVLLRRRAMQYNVPVLLATRLFQLSSSALALATQLTRAS